MKLFIAEKPSMAKEIAACLPGPYKAGNGCIVTGAGVVTWAFGHILRMAAPEEYDAKYKAWRSDDLPIVPEDWKLIVSESCKTQFQIIKKLIGEAQEIVHAGDPDREGQLLIDEVLEFVGNKKPVSRILLNALDEKSIKNALADLRPNKEFAGLKTSALGRQRADWLVGMNMSRAFTLAAQKAGHKMTFPVGRVKTPTLALVVRREREIESFKPLEHYGFKIDLEHANGPFTAGWQPAEDQKGLDEEGRLVEKAAAEEIGSKIAGAKGKASIVSFETKREKKANPLPFSLSTLQIAAGRKYGYSPQTVLDAAQSLYEKKLTTYPRSDCEYLPESQFVDSSVILQNLAGVAEKELAAWAKGAKPRHKSRAWNNSEISAHHAIIPTVVPCDVGKLSPVESSIYYLVARAYIAQFYPAYEYDQSSAVAMYAGEKFTATGKVIVTSGWKQLYSGQNEDEEKKPAEDGHNDELPAMKKGDSAVFKDLKALKKTTKPPERFTTSTLLQAMKNVHKFAKDKELQSKLKRVSGIGTEATRAGIIKELIDRSFMVEDKKKLKPTNAAYILIDSLPDELTYPDTTALWEDRLNDLAGGAAKLDDFLQEQCVMARRLCLLAQGAEVPVRIVEEYACPQCGTGRLRLRNGKLGEFWGCSNYVNGCKATYQDKKGKPDTAEYPCPKCDGMLKLIPGGKKGKFWGCSNYTAGCKTTFDDKRGKPDMAPQGNKKTTTTRSKRKA